jgi:hypothetical protein
VAPGDEVAVPFDDRVGADQQPEAAQCRAGQRVEQGGQQCPVGRLESNLSRAEVALQHGELMPQREDLGILIPIIARATAAAARTCSSHRGTPVAGARCGIIAQSSRPLRVDDGLEQNGIGHEA